MELDRAATELSERLKPRGLTVGSFDGECLRLKYDERLDSAKQGPLSVWDSELENFVRVWCLDGIPAVLYPGLQRIAIERLP